MLVLKQRSMHTRISYINIWLHNFGKIEIVVPLILYWLNLHITVESGHITTIVCN